LAARWSRQDVGGQIYRLPMDSRDVVDPADAKLQDLLAQLAEMTTDTAKRNPILDLILTLPPIAEWLPEAFEECRKTVGFDVSSRVRK
jgi:hypothetical protein